MMSSRSSIVVEPAAATAKEEDTGKPETEPAGAVPVKTTTTTERVPDSFIARIKTHPIPRARPLPGHYLFFSRIRKRFTYHCIKKNRVLVTNNVHLAR
jgi:hypothetical protein